MIKKIIRLFFKKPKENETFFPISNTSKDKLDSRDYLCSSPILDVIPDSYEIPNLPPVRNQKTIGSCCSHAVICAYETQLTPVRFIEGSELFHYYYARKMRGSFPDLTGMTIREGCTALDNYGFAFEQLWSYDVAKANEEPSQLAHIFSKLYKIKRYERLFNLNDIKLSLLENIPVVCGIYANSTFKKMNEINYLYDPQTKSGEGHAVMIYGYDDNRGVFKIRNSWGISHGDYGNFEMTYESFEKTSFDWWRIIIK